MTRRGRIRYLKNAEMPLLERIAFDAASYLVIAGGPRSERENALLALDIYFGRFAHRWEQQEAFRCLQSRIKTEAKPEHAAERMAERFARLEADLLPTGDPLHHPVDYAAGSVSSRPPRNAEFNALPPNGSPR